MIYKCPLQYLYYLSIKLLFIGPFMFEKLKYSSAGCIWDGELNAKVQYFLQCSPFWQKVEKYIIKPQ